MADIDFWSLATALRGRASMLAIVDCAASVTVVAVSDGVYTIDDTGTQHRLLLGSSLSIHSLTAQGSAPPAAWSGHCCTRG